MRIGHGYDAHRFTDDKPLVLGGVSIPFGKGLLAHSDGDVLVHAIADALLGGAGERDIGFNFPDTSDEYENIDSCILLEKVREKINARGLAIDYIDCTIIAQTPKLSPYISEMRERLADVLAIDKSRVNVKATTEEKMGFTGRCEGISAHAVCLLKE